MSRNAEDPMIARRHKRKISRCVLWSSSLVVFFCAFFGAMYAQATGFCDGNQRCTQAPWSYPELGVHTGVFVNTILHNAGGNLWTPFNHVEIRGRFRHPARGNFLDRLILEGSLMTNETLQYPSIFMLGGTLRIGLGWRYFAFTVGVYMRNDFISGLDSPSAKQPPSFQIFPSLVMVFRPGALAFTLSLLDRPDGALARLSVEYGSYGIAFSAIYGVEAFARVRLAPTWALELRGYANWWLQKAFSAGGSLGIVWGKGSVYQFGGAS